MLLFKQNKTTDHDDIGNLVEKRVAPEISESVTMVFDILLLFFSTGPLNLGLSTSRLLTECLILVGSAMVGATFNLLTRVGLPYFLEHRKEAV